MYESFHTIFTAILVEHFEFFVKIFKKWMKMGKNPSIFTQLCLHVEGEIMQQNHCGNIFVNTSKVEVTTFTVL